MLKLAVLYASVALCAAVAVAAAPGRGRSGRDFAANDKPTGPAPSLTAPATPTTKPDDDGFIRRWTLLEPIPAQGITQDLFRATVARQYFADQMSVIPKDGDKVTVDGEKLTWHAVESLNYNINLFHFTFALDRPTSNMFWWAVTVVNAPEDIKDVRLAIGSNDGSIWWLNGEELIGIYGNRMDIPDDGVSKKITLKKGPNIIRAAICNQKGPSDFCARFLDKDDKPINNFTISLSK